MGQHLRCGKAWVVDVPCTSRQSASFEYLKKSLDLDCQDMLPGVCKLLLDGFQPANPGRRSSLLCLPGNLQLFQFLAPGSQLLVHLRSYLSHLLLL